MKYEITHRGVYGADGVALQIGDEIEVKGDKVPGWLVNKAVPVKAGKAAKADTETVETPAAPEFVAPVGPFEAKERSPGWWAIYDAKGEVVGKSARKADLDGFDKLTEAEQLEFATDHAKTAFEAEQKKA